MEDDHGAVTYQVIRSVNKYWICSFDFVGLKLGSLFVIKLGYKCFSIAHFPREGD